MMRSLGRSMGRKGRALLSNRTDHYYSFNSSSRSAPFMHLSRCISVDGGRDASGGSRLSYVAKAVSLLEKVVKLWEKEPVQEPRDLKVQDVIGLKEGDTVDLSRLLFTKDRDYLIKCNGGQQVKVEQLADKMVVIYFDSIREMDKECLKSLTNIYNDLPPEDKFEVIFVDTSALDRNQLDGKPFGNEFSTLPWSAIPSSDVKSRRLLKKAFRICRVRMGTFVVINSAGVILHWDAIDIFCRYGVAGYPFTKKKIDELKSEDDKDVKNPSLNALLASHKRDYLVSNKGEKVPIRTLEDKVVALFFYTGCKLHQDFMAKLKVAYEELRVKNQDFEVVLIYINDSDYTKSVTSEETFSKAFKTMPWLALPHGDSSYYKLKRLFFLQWQPDSEDYGLIVIGPRTKFIQPFGLSILEEFKSPAYPFSCERVAELVAEKAKELELKMLWHPDGVFGGKYRSEEVKLDQFVNKNVIVLYDCYGIPLHGADKVIQKLKERYESMGTNDEFEVIHITTESPRYVRKTKLPWDVVQLDHDYTDEPNLFGLPGTFTRIPSLLAFDRDGRIVRKTMFPTFDKTEFPFYSGGIEKEALSQLTEVFEWDQFQQLFKGTIYTYKKNSD